jgi:hypothetical protein
MPGQHRPKPPKRQKEKIHMWYGLAAVLFIAWILGFVVFHVAGFFIHLLLIFAVISLVFQLIRRA